MRVFEIQKGVEIIQYIFTKCESNGTAGPNTHISVFMVDKHCVRENGILCVTGARSAEPETKGLADIRKSSKEKRLELWP